MANAPIELGDHPIFDRHWFFIETPMLAQLRTVLLQWLWCGASGGVVLGDARVGKSRAFEGLSGQLLTRAQEPIPVHRMTVAGRDQRTIASVFRNLAYAVDRPPKKNDTADMMVNALVHFLAESALVNRHRQVVLVVDELQRLLISQMAAFAELYDKLVLLHVNLLVVFVGNEGESDEVLRHIDRPEHSHIRGRFFTQIARFAGISTLKEIEQCLQHYDTQRFPLPSGPTLTEYFLPQAYAQGWRLKSLARPIWQVYREHYQRPLQLPSWGMQYFVAAINTLLADYLAAFGSDDEAAVEGMINESIKVSGLASTRVMAL